MDTDTDMDIQKVITITNTAHNIKINNNNWIKEVVPDAVSKLIKLI
jgi:hypothetical protein